MLHRISRDLDEAAADFPVWHHVDAVLEAILKITMEDPGDEIHLRLARGLADALGCHTAFIGALIRGEDGFGVRTLAVWSRGEPGESYEYPLAGTPCEEAFTKRIF